MYMSNGKNKRLQPAILQADRDAFDALKGFTDYVPANPDFTIEKVTAAYDALDAAQSLAVQAQATADAARDTVVTRQWEFHEMILGVRDQAKARYGPNSDEVQALGIKKKSEYKPRSGGASSKKGSGTS
jgi:hypothetical protein